MIAFCFAVLAVVTGGVVAGYAGSSSGNDLDYGVSGDSHGYGYSGSFSGSGAPPNFAFPAFDFSGFLGSLGRYHDEFITNPASRSRARAQSSLTFRNRHSLQNSVQEHAGGFSGVYGDSGGHSGGYGGSFGSGNDNAFGGSYSGPGSYSYSTPNTGPHVYPETMNFYSRGSFDEPASGGVPGRGSFTQPTSGAASSSASVGPQGVHQTAAVYPTNPNSPNINTRFAAVPSGGGGGFRSVFTSSQSHTSNVGGKPVTVQKAITTVNDNGKITTYTANNP